MVTTKLEQQLEQRAGLAACRRARLRTEEYHRICRELGVAPDDCGQFYLEALREEAGAGPAEVCAQIRHDRGART
jgi:hypothetical protein